MEKMLAEGNNGKSFYSATKKLASAAPHAQWSVAYMFVGKSDEEIGNTILDFFGSISDEVPREMPELRGVVGGLGDFDVGRTAEIIRNSKKVSSMVKGDPRPNLARDFPMEFAVPVSEIYNRINIRGKWPTSWKTEHLTIIPKNPNPSDLSECRNISCTSLFSKILEGQVLSKLREELQPDPNQYGGVPKCGVEHMLVDLWEEVLSRMEGGKTVAVLLGVDYEKAFNRMDHAVCIEELGKLGASPGSLALARAFLENRRMTINTGRGNARKIVRGSPQGSVLGCLLYCAATQLLTKGLRNRPRQTVRYFPEGPEDQSDIEFWEPPTTQPQTFLYVDDTTILDIVDSDKATVHITTGPTEELFRDLEVKRDFAELSGRAEDIGMNINNKNMQLLVISPPNGCKTSASSARTRDQAEIQEEGLDAVQSEKSWVQGCSAIQTVLLLHPHHH